MDKYFVFRVEFIPEKLLYCHTFHMSPLGFLGLHFLENWMCKFYIPFVLPGLVPSRFVFCVCVWGVAWGRAGGGCGGVGSGESPLYSRFPCCDVFLWFFCHDVFTWGWCTMFISTNRASFHLRRKENLVKHQKVSKYENDCRLRWISVEYPRHQITNFWMLTHWLIICINRGLFIFFLK